MVSELVKDITLLLVGADLSHLGGWVESKRTRKWMLEDRKRNQVKAAIEVRLKEAEDIIKTMSGDAYYVNHLIHRMLNLERLIDLKDLNGQNNR